MEEQVLNARRATLDDLPALRDMWANERLPVEELDKRVTEFQVAHDAAGTILGAIGFRRDGEQALIHSEAFADFSLADEIRRLIWTRFDTLSKNYAINRVWLQEDLMYWKEKGFDPPQDEVLEKLPELFGEQEGTWFTMVLREELFASPEAKRTEMIFQQSIAADRERTEQKIRKLKVMSTIIAFVLFVLVCIAGFYFLKYARNSNYGEVPYSVR
ncbi:MAG: hypothetical protein ACJASX_004130 [Limisphaerales bacterium]|jgi:hypothetical protein